MRYPGSEEWTLQGCNRSTPPSKINKEDGGELHRLILKAEGPLHDNFSFVRLSQEEAENLKGSIGTIAEWIKAQVPEIGNEEYTVDDYLVVRTEDNGTKGERKILILGDSHANGTEAEQSASGRPGASNRRPARST